MRWPRIWTMTFVLISYCILLFFSILNMEFQEEDGDDNYSDDNDDDATEAGIVTVATVVAAETNE